MQDVIIVYSERLTMKLIKDFNRACESFREHKKTVFDEEEEKHRRLEFDKYLRQFKNHAKLFTSECLTAPAEIDAAIQGMSRSTQMKVIKEQLDIWVHGAGWKDVRVTYSRGKVQFSVEYLTDKLKDLLRKHLNPENPRNVRAQVPKPSELSGAKKMPDLGDGLSDAVALREKALADEQERINMMHDDMGIP